MERFFILNFRRLREKKLRTAISIVGVASGVALVVAMLSLLTSVDATARSTVQILGGAKFEVISPGGVDEALASDLASVVGVAGVRRFVQAPVLVDGAFGWVVAIDPESRAVATLQLPRKKAVLATPVARALASVTGLRSGSAFSSSGVVSIVGQDGHEVRERSSGEAPSDLGGYFANRFVAADVDTALRLSGLPRATTVAVFGTPTQSALREVVGKRASVESTNKRVAQARHTFEVLFSSLSIMGTMGLVVGGFLLFNTMNMAVLDRRHELASLRALGSDRRSILKAILAEAALLGAIGSLLGIVLGAMLARSVISTIPDAFARSIGTPLRSSVPAILLAPAWAIGVIVSLVAAIGPARRTLRIEPIEALRPEEANTGDDGVRIHWPATAAAVALFVMVATVGNATIPSTVSLGLAIAATLLLTWALASPITIFVQAVARSLGSSGRLAALSLERAPRRVWATTATVMVSIVVAVAATGVSMNLRTTLGRDLETGYKSDFWVSTTASDNISLTALPTDWEAKIASIPGVRSVAGNRWISMPNGDRTVGILGILGDSAFSFYRGAADEPRSLMRAGKGAIVVRQYARPYGTKVGDVIDVPGAVPPLRLPVVAITEGVVASSGGLVAISMELFTKHFGLSAVTTYEAQLLPQADHRAVQRALMKLATTAQHPVKVFTAEQFVAPGKKAGDQVLSLIAMVLLVIVVCAGIAVLNTLLASVLERTREIAVLRAIGATRRQLVRSVVCEALAIGLAGGLLGTAIGSFLHAVLIERLREWTSFHMEYAFSPLTTALAVLSGIGIALIGSSIPARRVAHLDLLSALAR